MRCNNCGADVPDGTHFCLNCGNILDDSAGATQDSVMAGQQAMGVQSAGDSQMMYQQNGMGVPPVMSKDEYKATKQAYKDARKAMGKSRAPLVAALVVWTLLVAAIAVVLTWYVIDQNGSKSQPTESSSSSQAMVVNPPSSDSSSSSSSSSNSFGSSSSSSNSSSSSSSTRR